jgi:hypothetical protein
MSFVLRIEVMSRQRKLIASQILFKVLFEIAAHDTCVRTDARAHKICHLRPACFVRRLILKLEDERAGVMMNDEVELGVTCRAIEKSTSTTVR